MPTCACLTPFVGVLYGWCAGVRGAYPPPAGESDILGLEMAGEVVSAGPDCILRIPVGTPVMSVR